MIDVKEAKEGDCVYVLLPVQQAPVFAEIISVSEIENAVSVYTETWGSRTVVADNAYWEEKEAKKAKIIKITHNYKQWAQEYFRDEETKIDNRIDSIHNGKPEETEHSRESSGNKSVSKSSKSKQKVVRKSTTRKRKSTKNRKTRSSKK